MIVGYDDLTKWVCATVDQRYAHIHVHSACLCRRWPMKVQCR